MEPRATGEWRGVNQAVEGATTSTMTRVWDHMDTRMTRDSGVTCAWSYYRQQLITPPCQNPDSAAVTEPFGALDQQPQPGLVGAEDRKQGN